jgi:hypothetical protein
MDRSSAWVAGSVRCFVMPAFSSSARPSTRAFPTNAALVPKAAPALFPRSFDGIADRRPPQRPYASGEARVGN